MDDAYIGVDHDDDDDAFCQGARFLTAGTYTHGIGIVRRWRGGLYKDTLGEGCRLL